MAKKLIKLTESDLERIVSKVIQEQSVLGTLANVGEIGLELANSVVNSLPIVSVANMVKTAASGDAKSLSQVIDQEKARLGQNYQTLKNSITQGDVSKNLSNLATFLSQASQPFVSQMKSGLGNKPQPVAMKQGGIKEHKKYRPIITEAAAEMAIADAEERFASGEKPDPKLMGQIKQCITQKQLTSLMFLTTSAGTYALGIIAMLIMSGVGSEIGFAAGGLLALGSIITLFITGLSEEDGGLGADPSRDVKALLSCVKI